MLCNFHWPVCEFMIMSITTGLRYFDNTKCTLSPVIYQENTEVLPTTSWLQPVGINVTCH